MDKKLKSFIREYKDQYAQIGHVKCPAFNNEKVVFHKYGLRHLIRKGRRLRKIPEIKTRLKSILLAKEVLSQNTQFSSRREYANNVSKVQFWSFDEIIGKAKFVTIVRQIDNKPKHFFSIFKSQRKSKQTPIKESVIELATSP